MQLISTMKTMNHAKQVEQDIIMEAIRAVRTHVGSRTTDSDRRDALAKLYNAVLQLPDDSPYWKSVSVQK